MDEIKKEFKVITPLSLSPQFNKPKNKDTSYYNLHNVEDTLPKIPVSKLPPKLDPYSTGSGVAIGSKNGILNNNMGYSPFINQANNYNKNDDTPTTTTTNTTDTTPGTPNFPLSAQPKDPLRPPSILHRHLKQQLQQLQNGKKEGGSLIEIPWFIRPFVNLSADRAKGRAGRIYKLGLRSADGRTRDVYIILLFYQTVIGAIGGISVSVETGYLSSSLPTNNPGTTTAALATETVGKSTFLTGTSMIWRTAKRAAVAGLLFNFMDKNIEESRNKSDWKNSAYAGAICGALFGSRGGARGSFMGATMFGAFAGLSGFLDELKRKHGVK